MRHATSFIINILILLLFCSGESRSAITYEAEIFYIAPPDSARRGDKEKTTKQRVPKEGEKNKEPDNNSGDAHSHSGSNVISDGLTSIMADAAMSCLGDAFSCCWTMHTEGLASTFDRSIDPGLDSLETERCVSLMGPQPGLMLDISSSRASFMGDLSSEYGGAWAFGAGLTYVLNTGIGVSAGYEFQISQGEPKYDYKSTVYSGGNPVSYIYDKATGLSYYAHVFRAGIVYRYMPKIDSKNELGLHAGLYGVVYMITDEAGITRRTEYPGGGQPATMKTITETLKFTQISPSLDFGFNYKFGQGSKYSFQWKVRYDILLRKAEKKISVPHDWADMEGNLFFEIGFVRNLF